MAWEIENETGGWDRTCLDLSSKMAEPLVQGWSLLRYRLVAPLDPKKFDNCASKAAEIGVRILIVVGAFFLATAAIFAPIPIFFTAVVLGVGSRVLRVIGFALQKNNYTYVRGKIKILSKFHS